MSPELLPDSGPVIFLYHHAPIGRSQVVMRRPQWRHSKPRLSLPAAVFVLPVVAFVLLAVGFWAVALGVIVLALLFASVLIVVSSGRFACSVFVCFV